LHSGNAPAFQAGVAGSIPAARSIAKPYALHKLGPNRAVPAVNTALAILRIEAPNEYDGALVNRAYDYMTYLLEELSQDRSLDPIAYCNELQIVFAQFAGQFPHVLCDEHPRIVSPVALPDEAPP
jgi:hypothetical protein